MKWDVTSLLASPGLSLLCKAEVSLGLLILRHFTHGSHIRFSVTAQRKPCEKCHAKAATAKKTSGSFRVVSLNLACCKKMSQTLFKMLPRLIDPDWSCRLLVPVASNNRKVLHSSYVPAAEPKCLVLFP